MNSMGTFHRRSSRRSRAQRVVMVGAVLAAQVGLALSPLGASPGQVPRASALGSYDNARIADIALGYLGRWGAAACVDAGRSGATGGAPLGDGHNADSECRAFVNCIVRLASGNTQWPASGGYYAGFTNAGGMEVSGDSAVKGDIIQVRGDGSGHTAIVVANLGGGLFDVVDSNYDPPYGGRVAHHQYRPPAGYRVFRMGTPHAPGPDLVTSLSDDDLYRVEGGPEVYVVIGGARFHITNPDELQRRLDNGEGPVLNASRSAHESLGTVPRNGTLFRDEDRLNQYFVVAGAAMPVLDSNEVALLAAEGVDTTHVSVAPPGTSSDLGPTPDSGVVVRGPGGQERWLIDGTSRRQIPPSILECIQGSQDLLLVPRAPLNAMPVGPPAECRNVQLHDRSGSQVLYVNPAGRAQYVPNPAIRDCLAVRLGIGQPRDVSSAFLAALPRAARNATCPCPVGSMVRETDRPEVWLVRPGRHRVHVSTERQVVCLGGWNNVGVVPANETEGYVADAGHAATCPIERMMLHDNTPGGSAVVFVDGQGRSAPVPNPSVRDCIAVRRGVGGPRDVSLGFMNRLPQRGRTAWCPYPAGSVVRENDSPTVWLILSGGRKQYVSDAATRDCLLARIGRPPGGESVVPADETDGHTLVPGTATCA